MKRLILILFLLCGIAYGDGQVTVTPAGGSVTNLTSIATRNFSDLQFTTAAVANITLSDPTKTLLLGASAIPDVTGSLWPWSGAQLLISGRVADAKAAFAVVGAYRSGSSGERASAYIGTSGEIYTNAYIAIWGSVPEAGITDTSAMLTIGMDTPTGIIVKGTGAYFDASGYRLLTGWGPPDNNSAYARSFDIGTQGTLRLNNNYGQTGATQYSLPQIILKDIGADVASPAATYGSIRQAASGHLYLGTYNNSTNAQGNEINITSGAVAITGLTATNATFTTPALGTPSSLTLTNATGLPITGITSTTSAQLRTLLSDENGTGAALFSGATSPVFVTPDLGTPSALVLTNASGTASININGTVGATTPAAGTFTALTGTSGTLAGLTGLAIRDTSAAFDVTLAAVSSTTLTAGRTLTLNMGNVAHTLALGTTAGTITFPNTAAMTVARIDTGQNFSGIQEFGGTTKFQRDQQLTWTNANSFGGGSVIGLTWIADGDLGFTNGSTTKYWTLGISGLIAQAGTTTSSITGGAGNMTITAGTGNSRTMALRTTTSGGTATTALTLNADQSATFAAGVTVTGASTLTGGIVGTTTNDNATALNVGQEIESLKDNAHTVSLSNGTAADVTSISLTAGDWDVEGNVNFTETTSTVTARSAGISTTSATLPTDGSEAYCGVQSTVTSETNSIALPRKRISIASTTTVYLVGKATFSAGTCTEFGAITARRVR